MGQFGEKCGPCESLTDFSETSGPRSQDARMSFKARGGYGLGPSCVKSPFRPRSMMFPSGVLISLKSNRQNVKQQWERRCGDILSDSSTGWTCCCQWCKMAIKNSLNTCVGEFHVLHIHPFPPFCWRFAVLVGIPC